MNKKIILILGILSILILSGCIDRSSSRNLTGDTQDPTVTPVPTPIPHKQIVPTTIIDIPENYNDGDTINVYHITDNGKDYTCFYTQGMGQAIYPSLSCTRDLQPPI